MSVAKFLPLGLFFLVAVVVVVVRAESFQNETLKGQSVLYGVSSLAEKDNSTECYRQLQELHRGIEMRRVWALKALDASGTPGPGFLYGNNLWLGSHAQCSDISNKKKFEISYIKVKHPDPTPHDFPPYPMGFTMVYLSHNNTMQHHAQLPLEFTIQLGLCLPESCSPEDLGGLMEDYLREKHLNIQNLFDLNLEVLDLKRLESNGQWMFEHPETIILIIIAAVVVVLAIAGTVCDMRKHNHDKNLTIGHRGNLALGKQQGGLSSVSEAELVSNTSLNDMTRTSTLFEVVKCFSIYSNVKTLVNTDLPGDSVPIIHGLRFFGMLWVIMVHAVFYQADYLENIPLAYRLSEDIFAQILSNSTYCVDTYLFISGFLVGYLFLKANKIPCQKPVNMARKAGEFCMMCFNRFLRLTPPYIVVILLTDVLYTYYRRTSALHSSERADLMCSKYWWRNVLYINNLYPRSEMCMSWSWYLSLDSQFFAITAFLLILSTITFKTTAILTVVLILGNVIATTWKSYSIGYIPTMDEQLAQLDAIYDLPWNRIGPYLIGMITAYVLLVKLERKLVLKERTRILLWCTFPFLNLWILFTIYTRQVSVEFSAIYMGISRTLWGIGLGWLLIACCTGNARALENFLAFKGFIPLSRLTYCAYLLNPLVANMIYLGSETSYNASLASFSLTIQGITLISFYLSFIFSVLFESPFILLTKMLFNKMFPKKKPASKEESDNKQEASA